MAANFHNLEGKEINGFKVLSRHSVDNKGRVIWLCQHHCGHEQTYRSDRIRAGICACAKCRAKRTAIKRSALAKQKRQERTAQGEGRYAECRWPSRTWTGEYQAYQNAKGRCNNVNNPTYPRYGGRGIQFLWASFDEFMDEMGPRPEGLTLDRIDNNGHYAKGNCRWATFRNNQLNREVTVLVSYQGTKQPLIKVLEDHQLGCQYAWVTMRLQRGYSFDDILANLLAGNFAFGRKQHLKHTKRMMALPLDQMSVEYLSLPRMDDGRVKHGWLTSMAEHYKVLTCTMIRRAERHLKSYPQLAHLVPCDISHFVPHGRTDLSRKAKAVLSELALTSDDAIKAAIQEGILDPIKLHRKAYGRTTYKEICGYVGINPPAKEKRVYTRMAKDIDRLPERIGQLKRQLEKLERKLAAQCI